MGVASAGAAQKAKRAAHDWTAYAASRQCKDTAATSTGLLTFGIKQSGKPKTMFRLKKTALIAHCLWLVLSLLLKLKLYWHFLCVWKKTKT